MTLKFPMLCLGLVDNPNFGEFPRFITENSAIVSVLCCYNSLLAQNELSLLSCFFFHSSLVSLLFFFHSLSASLFFFRSLVSQGNKIALTLSEYTFLKLSHLIGDVSTPLRELVPLLASLHTLFIPHFLTLSVALSFRKSMSVKPSSSKLSRKNFNSRLSKS